MKNSALRAQAEKLNAMLEQSAAFSSDELADLRSLLLKALREQQLVGLNGAKDAPIPGESAPVSEAYLRALSDDLDAGAGERAQ
jgi:hypothetical protein